MQLFNDDEENQPGMFAGYTKRSEPMMAPPVSAPAAPSEPPPMSYKDLLAKEEENTRNKGYLGVLGSVAQNFADIPSAHEMLYGGKAHHQDMKGMMKSVTDNMNGPMDAQSKAMAYMKAKRDDSAGAAQDEANARDKQVDSNESKALRQLAPRWNIKVTPDMTASDIKQLINPQKMMQTEAEAAVQLGNQKAIHQMDNSARSADRTDAREERNFQRDQKRDEKELGLKTPFGVANTEDDAKKLKEGFESKKNFDNKINEMISLREKHGGGSVMNRDDVARGKQLSKDLLLEYKNMAKLGVLSASDENIINAIIPEDPLAFNSPLAAIQGQDPILHKLKSFKGDSDKDFQTRVQTRTRGGGQAKTEKTIVKTQTNQKTGEKRIVYSDGSTETVASKTAGQ